MTYSTRILARAAQGAITLVMIAFAIAAIAFLVFGFMPIAQNPQTGETTYRVIGDTFTMDRTIAASFSIGMGSARFVSHLVIALGCALFAAFFLQLFLILRSVGRGDPFTQTNARRLDRMGWIVLLVLAGKIAKLSAGGELADIGEGIEALLALTIGLSFLALGHVFRVGAAMRDDLEGTI